MTDEYGPIDQDPVDSIVSHEARRLGIETAVARAILRVESPGGCGFQGDRMVIRFEVHLFSETAWARQNQKLFADHYSHSRDKRWTRHLYRVDHHQVWRTVHLTQDREWAALTLACDLGASDEDAWLSTSMGAPQVLGLHHAMMGYEDATEMALAWGDLEHGRARQVIGLFRYLERCHHSMLDWIRAEDWDRVARAINGSGQVAHYAAALAEAVAVERSRG